MANTPSSDLLVGAGFARTVLWFSNFTFVFVLLFLQVKLDDGDRQVLYVRLLTHMDGGDEAPEVNMLRVRVARRQRTM